MPSWQAKCVLMTQMRHCRSAASYQ